jgi:hypothetical protein
VSGGKDDWRSSLFIGLGLAGLGLGGGLAAASGTMGPAAIPVWIVTAVMVTVAARSPFAKALAQRMLDEGAADAHAVGDEVYAELDELRGRVLELEERQDFAERMLSNRSEVVEGP